MIDNARRKTNGRNVRRATAAKTNAVKEAIQHNTYKYAS